ncbi:MAG TPA: arylsulfotransferase family protein [Solirubrobacterales bacterium]|nr:arylsulfotransferase family protein [Solirubrobacterales bacterium]
MLTRIRLLPLLAVALLAAAAPASASAAHPTLGTGDGDALLPGFEWGVGTYGARCNGDGLTLTVGGAKGWSTAIGGGKARRGGFSAHVDLSSGEGTRISFSRRDRTRRAYVRCLPEDMGAFTFQTVREGGPRLFTIQLPPNYAVVMNRSGAPVWWLATDRPPFDAQILPDGTVGWNGGLLAGNPDYGRWEERTLTGRLIRTVDSSTDSYVDVHDHERLPNGNDLIGAPTFVDHVDITAYGGPADARIRNTTLEELTPDGDVARSWDSGEHIGLDETPARWWPSIIAGAFANHDVSHWNAVDVVGKYMYLSFRHLDAIYKVNRRTGRIVWKLGGTETAKSLEVRGDPRGDYPLGAQHDVNVLDDGTITIFDNSTSLDRPPRGVRYRIDERRGVAHMVEQVVDPKIVVSGAGGSARRVASGWLIGWGVSAPGAVGAYNERGKPYFRITYARGASYRATEVPGSVSGAELRRAMNRMSR